MGVNTERFIRKPLYVDAVRVTSQNFEAVAAWCEGEIQKETEGPRTGKNYIRVRVQYPKSPRQSKAFVGDWVLYTETGYKVYTNPSFRKSFDKAPVEVVKEERPATADEIREKLPHAQDRRPQTPPQDEVKTHLETKPYEETVRAQEERAELQTVEPGADLGETPQGEQIEVVAATPQAIADAVNEQSIEPPKPGDEQDQWETVRAHEKEEKGAQPESPVPDERVQSVTPQVDSPEESTPLVWDHTPRAFGLGEAPTPEADAAGGPGSRVERNAAAKSEVPQPEPVSEQAPEDAAAGKRVLSEEEQAQMGPDAVREMVRTGDVILVQDLAA